MTITHKVYYKFGEINQLPPTEAFVFIDTFGGRSFLAHEISVSTPGLWVPMPAAARHSRHGVLSFVDGRVQIKRWQDPRTSLVPKNEPIGIFDFNELVQPNNPDQN